MEPKLIELARVGAGLTQGQLAKALHKSQPFISQVERGEKDIPADLLADWCQACGVPESFLSIGRLPLDDSVSAMVHRRMKTLPAKPHHLANAQVKMRVLEIDSLFAEIDLVPSLDIPHLPPGTGPSDAAAHLRRAWRIPAGPLPNLVELVESAGIPVVLMDSFHPKQSATSHQGRWCDWVITLNATHPASRRRFTLAHELGHIMLRHEASITADEDERERLEREADSFASELLMPKADARRELRAVSFKRLVMLKQRWLVSVAFLIRRALDVGMIDDQDRGAGIKSPVGEIERLLDGLQILQEAQNANVIVVSSQKNKPSRPLSLFNGFRLAWRIHHVVVNNHHAQRISVKRQRFVDIGYDQGGAP